VGLGPRDPDLAEFSAEMLSYVGAAVALWFALDLMIMILLGPGLSRIIDE
jgi:hypothetical protein